MHTTRHVKTTSGKARGRECNPQLFVMENREGQRGGRWMRFHINCAGSHECACVCVCVCTNMGWEVLVEFLRAMLILQAQQGCCVGLHVCTCKSACVYPHDYYGT